MGQKLANICPMGSAEQTSILTPSIPGEEADQIHRLYLEAKVHLIHPQHGKYLTCTNCPLHRSPFGVLTGRKCHGAPSHKMLADECLQRDMIDTTTLSDADSTTALTGHDSDTMGQSYPPKLGWPCVCVCVLDLHALHGHAQSLILFLHSNFGTSYTSVAATEVAWNAMVHILLTLVVHF